MERRGRDRDPTTRAPPLCLTAERPPCPGSPQDGVVHRMTATGPQLVQPEMAADPRSSASTSGQGGSVSHPRGCRSAAAAQGHSYVGKRGPPAAPRQTKSPAAQGPTTRSPAIPSSRSGSGVGGPAREEKPLQCGVWGEPATRAGLQHTLSEVLKATSRAGRTPGAARGLGRLMGCERGRHLVPKGRPPRWRYRRPLGTSGGRRRVRRVSGQHCGCRRGNCAVFKHRRLRMTSGWLKRAGSTPRVRPPCCRVKPRPQKIGVLK